MLTASEPLPHWDVSGIFPSLDSPEFAAAFARMKADVARLEERFDSAGVRRREEGQVDAATASRFEEVTGALNDLLERAGTLRAYIYAFVSTDAADEKAQALLSEWRLAAVTLSKLETRYVAWTGSLSLEALLERSPTAREHELYLRKAGYLAAHQMEEGEEGLSAELAPAGLSAWARLHDDMTALLTVPLELAGERKVLPMSALRALAHSPDRGVREAAHRAELRAWKSVEVPLAAALNGIKGWQGVLRRRRRYGDDVEPTLVANSIDAETLAAMQSACAASFPAFRRYLRVKARALGVERAAWFDLFAPLPGAEETQRFSWRQAEEFIEEQFSAYSPAMAAFARRSFRESWTDAEPRAGKQGGAFCMGIVPGESRILMNFDGSFNAIATLAHELGHAYHNLCLRECVPLRRRTPSTLAETASIFCETLVYDAAMRAAGPDERLALLDGALQNRLQVVVDIHSRFLFEREVFERRAGRELAAREFCELMLECERQTYGEGLDPEELHPYMWAVKSHYYGPTFYNYPYTFGLLFGLGLFRRFRCDPGAFREGYDALLASTGLADAAALGTRFGIDTRSPDFWRGSLELIAAEIDEFARVAA